MKNIRLFLATLLSVLLSAVAQAQRPFVVKPLGMERGLSSKFVVSMAQDKYGFLWFATEEGLNRFDGTRFHTYYKKRTGADGISGNELNWVLDDPHDSIMWIATQREGLDAYDYARHRFTTYKHDAGNPGSIITNDITNVQPAADGNIWVSTYWQGVELFHKRQQRFEHFNRKTVRGLPGNQVWSMLDDGEGHLYVGHVNHGLSIIDVRTRTARNFMHHVSPGSIAGNSVNCIYRDKAGNIWIGTDNGLDLFDPLTNEFIHVNPAEIGQHRVFCIRELSDGRLWIGTELGGLAILNVRRRLFSATGSYDVTFLRDGDSPAALGGNSIRCLFEDRFHNVWIGLYGAGVNVLTYTMPLFGRISYSPVDPHHHLTDKTVLSLCVDRQGNLWAGTDGHGIDVFAPSGERVANHPEATGSPVHAAFRDSRGNLWFGRFYGGATVRRPDGSFRQVFPARQRVDVRGFCEDRHHNIWIATSEGVYVADIATFAVKKHYNLRQNLARTIAQDCQGRYWVGTFGGGVSVYSEGFKLLYEFNTSDGFPSNTVNQIYCDSRGEVWVAGGEGLVRFSRSGSRHYEVMEWGAGLNNVHIHALAEDHSGNIWMSTNKGISCFNRRTGRISNYVSESAEVMGGFNSGCVARRADGTIFFGTTGGGLYYFNPTHVLARRPVSRPFITGLGLFRGNAERGDSIVNLTGCDRVTLDYTENTFRLSFNIQDPALADGVEYSYRLTGQRNEWVGIEGNDITLRNLPHGHYTLQVRARMQNRPWSEPARLDIEIRPPFWQSWWAWVAYVLLLAGAAWALLRSYNRHMRLAYLYRAEKQQHEREQELYGERMQFFTNITHELRTPLTLIVGPLEDISHAAHLPENLRHKLAVIHRNGMRLSRLIDRLLEFRKTESDTRRLCVARGNIVEAVHEVSLKYEELNRKAGVDIRFIAPDPDIDIFFDKEVITIVVDNLLSNALKYTEQGAVDVSVERHRHEGVNRVDITVSDTGYGISKEALPHIFEHFYQERGAHQASGTGIGLSLVKKLVELHQGTVKAESRMGQGSSFIVSLDADNDYPDALRGIEKPAAAGVETSPAEPEPTEHPERPVMLVVEDNKEIREYVAEAFAETYEVRQAGNGQQGWEMATACLPDMVISDIMMPVMDGNELCRRLKNDVRTSHVPVILLTAKDSMAAKEEGYDAGADSYITKPFSRSLLESRVNNLLLQRSRLSKAMQESRPQELEAKRRQLRESMNRTDREFFDHLNALIEERISGDIDVNYLAQSLALSTSTLYRKMKSLTGVSANEYVRRYKMRYAERLLLEGRYTISETAFMVGMNSIAYFRRCFKEAYGMLPSEYLRQLKNEEPESR